MDTFYSRICDLEDTAGLDVGGGAALSRNARKNQNRRNGAYVGNSRGGIVYIQLRYDLARHNNPPLPTSSESALELNLWTGKSKPCQTVYAINGVAQGYLPRQRYRGRCATHIYQYSL